MDHDKLRDACGIIGVWGNEGINVNELIYTGFFGIQHRGQQTAGFAFVKDEKIIFYKDVGLVSEIFDETLVGSFGGCAAGIGHVGYHTAADSSRESVQPLVFKYRKGQLAVAYNGCLLNAKELRTELEREGHVFLSGTDAEIIAILLCKARIAAHSMEKAMVRVMGKLIGAYSIIVMTPRKIIAARDARGMKPLCLGRLGGNHIIASETAGLNAVSAEFVRDVMPGEVLVLSDLGVNSYYTKGYEKTAMCIFEHIYLARTDSVIDGVSVYKSRFEAGRVLAMAFPVDADVVMGVPDSGIAAALGYAAESGIEYVEGLIKNRYIGRTFIQPSQHMRENAVALKLTPIRSRIEGKRVVMVDDSIVRGTTCKKIVAMLKSYGGAKEVHVRVSSPPVKYPCRYGIDTRDEDVLIAKKMGFEGVKNMIGADSLAFLDKKDLDKITPDSKCSFCKACFTGDYPLSASDKE